MFLDLASVITGGFIFLLGEATILGLIILWAILSVGKEEDEITKSNQCPFFGDDYCGKEKCESWDLCQRLEKRFEQYV